MKDYPNAQLLTTPAELFDALARDPKPLIIDLRPAEDYAAAHLPGAVHLDLWGVSLIDTDPAPLKAFMWMIEHLFELRGVDASKPLVVYDEQSGVRAARAFWFLEYFGHPRIHLLDGGFGAWTRAGLPTVRDGAAPQASTWRGTPRRAAIATWRDVKHRLGSREAVFVDTRTEGEYHGTTVRAKRGGAIPGAVHIEWTRNLGPDGFKDPRRIIEFADAVRGAT